MVFQYADITKLFTNLELRSANSFIHIREGDGWKTAFISAPGPYEYHAMPYGLVNAHSVFQAFLREFLNQFVIVYIDDVLMFSPSEKDHVHHVCQVPQCLLDTNFTVHHSGSLGIF